ncbi:MAG: beta-N-acetylhexosaminidase [Pseudomonadota bacterium]
MSGWGACILGLHGLTLSKEEVQFFQDIRPFGFILFARNIDTSDQVRALCASLRDAVGYNAPILIDQEGGRVQRLRGPTWREWQPPFDTVRMTGAHATEAMYAQYRLIAHELYDLGIDANCAPLLDVARKDTHPFLHNRCYSESIDTVCEIGRAVTNGLMDGGVLPVAKHIPGHGLAKVDSHFDLPVAEQSLNVLRQTDFVPFKDLNMLPMGMTAHVVYPALDELPATLSAKVIQVIRNEIGFDGLIMTDDISMKALQGDLGELAKHSLDAGCDVVLHCNGELKEAQLVAEASEILSENGLRRARAVLSARKSPKPVDIPALEAKLDQLLDG